MSASMGGLCRGILGCIDRFKVQGAWPESQRCLDLLCQTCRVRRIRCSYSGIKIQVSGPPKPNGIMKGKTGKTSKPGP